VIIALVAFQLSTPSILADSGQFEVLGLTLVSEAWKTRHSRDENFIYVMDSRTGRIQICSDADAVCRLLATSERDPKGIVAGRFAGVRIVAATAAWKIVHPADDHLIYTLDTTTGEIQICGDTEEACVILNATPGQSFTWPKVVMLYRRGDTAAITGRIYDHLVAHYGKSAVFMDVYNIPLAANWRQRVYEMSVHGGVIVAIVGSRWLGPLPDGQFRIKEANDPVRLELEAALQSGVPIFPVVVDGAGMPKSDQLPDTVKMFSSINAGTVDSGRDFHQHMLRLIEALDQLLAGRVTANTK
jgi:hypothetical protein